MIDYDEYASGGSKRRETPGERRERERQERADAEARASRAGADAGGGAERGAGTGGSSGADDPGAGSSRRERYKVSGDQLLSKVKELIREGNVRRITIRNEEGRVLLEIPLSVGVVGTLLAPPFAAIGAMAALVASCSIEVERHE